MTVTLKVTTEYATVHGAPSRTVQMLIDTLRYFSKAATEFNPGFASGRWDGYVKLFDQTYCRFPTGLLPRVTAMFKREGIEYAIEKHLPDLPQEETPRLVMEDVLRPYQEEAIERAIKVRRGIIRIPTGGGKSHVAIHIVNRAASPRTVFLVPNRVLLHQIHKRFKAAYPDIPVIKWGDSSKDIDIPWSKEYILISTVQSAWTRTNSPFLSEATAVIVDECHHQAADTFQKATRTSSKARYLLGLSATPFRDDGADLEMEAWLGPIIYSIGYQELIADGYLVPPEFHFIRTLEEAFTITKGLRTLIFSEKIKELEDERDIFELHNAPVLTSKNKSREISEYLLRLERGDITHIAATPLFDEGLDIPNLDAVVYFATGRSKVRTIQRIGRAMRPYPGKTKCLVVDMMNKGFSDRMGAYMSEPAFRERLPKHRYATR